MVEAFHQNVVRLLVKTNEPCKPEGYRGRRFESSPAYVLLHEEEQHLADNLAFLTQTRSGPHFVSAVTLVQGSRSQSFVVRLAANKTPSVQVVERLQAVLETVRECAGAGTILSFCWCGVASETCVFAGGKCQKSAFTSLWGIWSATLEKSPQKLLRCDEKKTPGVANTMAGAADQERLKSRLFDKVIELSAQRIYTRIGSSRAKKQKTWPPPKKRHRGNSLYSKIEDLLEKILAMSLQHDDAVHDLHDPLRKLALSLKDVDNGTQSNEVELLKEVIQNSFKLSTIGHRPALAMHLRSLKCPRDIYGSRTVLEIDKLGRYLALCNDLIHFSQKATCQPFFRNIRLETCIAPPTHTPPGARIPCGVHGEVQLALYHDQHPTTLPPRAIGSSKSACFLCDLFLAKHGGFQISHTHKRLYEKWTFSPTGWMTKEQASRFQQIIEEMNTELLRYIDGYCRRPGYEGNGPESVVHILELSERASGITPTKSLFSINKNVASSSVAEAMLHTLPEMPPEENSADFALPLGGKNSLSETRNFSPNLPPTPDNSKSVLPFEESLDCYTLSSDMMIYEMSDLPIRIQIYGRTKSHVLKAGDTEYLFDFEDISILASSNYQLSQDQEKE